MQARAHHQSKAPSLEFKRNERFNFKIRRTPSVQGLTLGVPVPEASISHQASPDVSSAPGVRNPTGFMNSRGITRTRRQQHVASRPTCLQQAGVTGRIVKMCLQAPPAWATALRPPYIYMPYIYIYIYTHTYVLIFMFIYTYIYIYICKLRVHTCLEF